MERSTRAAVTFARPFRLGGVEWLLPPGTYEIETLEEQLAGLTFTTYRRLSTTVTLENPATGARQITEIDPGDLAAALNRELVERNG